MGMLAPQTVLLPDGTPLTIRSATLANDSEQLLQFRLAVIASTDQLMTQPGEGPDLEAQRSYVERVTASDRSAVVLGLTGDHIVATVSMEGDRHGRRRAAHVCDLGIAVEAQWRGRGVGTAVTRAALDWAAAHPAIEVVALCVFSSNPRAEALYRRFGFVRDGVRPRHAQIRPGEYVDDVMMTLFVKPGLAPPGYNTYLSSGVSPAAVAAPASPDSQVIAGKDL